MRQIKKSFTLVLALILPIILLASCKKKEEEKPEHIHDYVLERVVDATCTTEGYSLYACTCGEKVERDKVNALGHSYGQWEIVLEPTSSKTGLKQKICSRCQDTIKENIPALIYTYGNWEIVIAPTLTEEGKIIRLCVDTGENEEFVLPKLDDEKYKTTVTTKPTCSSVGTKEFVYNKDGKEFKFTITLPMSEHDIETDSKPATCLESGYEKKKCKNCDYEDTKIINALGHEFVRNGAACEADEECIRCHAKGELQQKHALVPTINNATCASEGSVIYTCSICNKVISTTIIPRLEHTIGEYQKSGEASQNGCKVTQRYEAECSECHEKSYYDEVTYKHNYESELTKEATCQSEGLLTYKCSDCDAEGDTVVLPINPQAHKYDDGVKKDGKITYTCEICNATKIVIDNTSSTEANVSSDQLKASGGVELEGNTSITLDDKLLETIPENVKISANTIDKDSLNLSKDVLNEIGDNKIYDFKLVDGENNKVDFNGGKVTVRLPYTLSDDEIPTDIVVYYINDNGEIESFKANYSNGYVEFETGHFSYYSVTKLSKDKCKIYGHTYIKTKALEPTCNSDGYFIEMCAECGEAGDKEIIEKLGHNFIATTTNPTCMEAGKTVEECERCHVKKENFIEALGHNYVLDEATYVAASCEHKGHEEYQCSRCDSSFTTDTIQLQHQYQTSVVQPTCTSRGYTLYECSNCPYSYKDSYKDALGHSYIIKVVSPTCTEKGYTLHQCNRCEDNYEDNEVAPAHTWNLTAPTCGEDQVCVICGEKGLPATNEHDYNNNGVCNVCGNGCEHEYDEKVVQPTCTEDGYTLNTCKKCNHTEKTNIVKKTGHKGSIVCDICGAKLISNDYVGNLLLSIYDKESITISCNNIHAVENNIHGTFDYKLNFSATIKLDENNKLYGYGIIKGIYYYKHPEHVIENMNVVAEIIIKDNKAYMYSAYNQAVDTNSLENIDFNKFNYDYYSNKAYNSYQIYDLEELLNQMNLTTDIIKEMLNNESIQKIISTIKNIISKDDYLVNRLLTQIISRLFILDAETSEYKLAFNSQYFIDIYNYAKNHTISELFDYIIYDGAYQKLYDFINNVGNLTIKDLLDATKETGLSLDEIISLINQIPVGENTNLEALIKDYLQIEGQTLVEYLTSSAISSQKVVDFVKNIVGENFDYTQYTSVILNYLNSFKDVKLFELLKIDDEMIKTIDSYVEAYKNTLNLVIYTNPNGVVLRKEAVINLDCEMQDLDGNEFEFKFNGNFDISYNNECIINEELYNTIKALDEFDIINAIINSGYELITDDNNEPIGFKYTYENNFSNTYNNKDYVEKNYYKSVYTYDILFDMLGDKSYYDGDCGNWYAKTMYIEQNINYTCDNIRRYEYYDKNGVLISTYTDSNSLNDTTNCLNVHMLINLKTGSIIFGDYDSTAHNFKITENVPVDRCESFGHITKVCSDCGYVETKYTVKSHNYNYSNRQITLNDPSIGCDAGAVVKEVCDDCGKINITTYDKYNHNYLHTYVLAQGSSSCEDGVLEAEICSICGKINILNNNVRYIGHDYIFKEYDLGEYDIKGNYYKHICSVCNKVIDINYKIEDKYNSTINGNVETRVYNSKFKIVITNTEKQENCLIKYNHHYQLIGNDEVIFEYDETLYDRNHDIENIYEENENQTINRSTCKNCGKLIEDYIKYFSNGKLVKEYNYYLYNNNDGSYSTRETTTNYDNGYQNYSEYIYKQYDLNGNLLNIDRTCIEYETINGVTYDKKRSIYNNGILRYTEETDLFNCNKTTINYDENGKIENTIERDYHVCYILVTAPTCTQFGIYTCKCGAETKTTRYLGHNYEYNDEKKCYVCNRCHMESEDYYNKFLFENLFESDDEYIIGTLYSDFNNYSDLSFVIIDGETTYENLPDISEITNNYKYEKDISNRYSISKSKIKKYLESNEITSENLQLVIYVVGDGYKYSMTINLNL